MSQLNFQPATLNYKLVCQCGRSIVFKNHRSKKAFQNDFRWICETCGTAFKLQIERK